jgi:O-6-methylguanine DNA methyltransferase
MALTYTTMESPVGALLLAATEVGLCNVTLGDREEAFRRWVARHVGQEPRPDAAPLAEVLIQMREYFSRLRQQFRLPLDLRGTPFQRAVWRETAAIPYGTTVTYGEIARRLGRSSGSARAVGAAVGANPLPIVIPCHRVIGASGSLTGYGGGLAAKATLLRLEGVDLDELQAHPQSRPD